MSLATAITIIGLAVAVFFNPIWIAFEQERTGVPAITGYTREQVRNVTGSILADVVFGPPTFTATVDGQPVLDTAERSHMVDVHDIMRAFGAVVGLAILALVVVAWTNRRHAWTWRAVARGSGALAIVGVVVGIAVVFFFNEAFLLFHLVFFPQGNFSFDPRTERLTQLFPDLFWTETTIALALVGMGLAVVIALWARHRASRVSG